MLDTPSILINIINMKNAHENPFSLSADHVCNALNISRQTLYAYVSRGKVRAQAQSEDARKSLYHAHDVEQLLAMKQRGRSRRAIAKSTVSFGEPILKSDISHISEGQLFYKGFDAIKLSQKSSFEDIAKLFLDIDLVDFNFDHMPQITARNSFERMIAAISELLLGKHSGIERHEPDFILKFVRAALCAQTSFSPNPAHIDLAHYASDDPAFEDICRRCLILCADHELNASAFSARVAASTNARLPACLLAAISTFSGTKHGSMPSMTRWWVGRAAMKQGDDQLKFVQNLKTPPGFGHPVYPKTDPRCAELLKYLTLPDGWANVRDLVHQEHGLYPNLDFSLAVMEKHFSLRPKTAQTLFAYGRMLGWIAHVKEQQESGKLIRPRAFV